MLRIRSGCSAVVDDPLVVGVRVLLGAPGGERPVVQRGFDLLHRQVGALDHADLDRGAAVGAAGGGPLLQSDHGGQGIGQVGLQHDAGLEVLELGLVEDPGEDRDGQVEVLVLLHVQVDELGLSGRRRRGLKSGVSFSTTCSTASSKAQAECGATVEETLIET